MENIESIIQQWADDVKIDDMKLDDESLRVSILHAKYVSALFKKKRELNILTQKKKQVKAWLEDYYAGDLNGTDNLKNRAPWQKRLTKSGIDRHVEADKDMVAVNLKIAETDDCVTLLSEILSEIRFRGNRIKAAIDWKKFIAGQ